MYSLIGVLVFIAIGGDGWVITGLARTYEAVPLLDSPQIGSITEGAQVAFSGIFAAAIMICAPVLLALGLEEFSLHPSTLLELRRAIRGLDLGALRSSAPALLRARDRAGIEAWLANQTVVV